MPTQADFEERWKADWAPGVVEQDGEEVGGGEGGGKRSQGAAVQHYDVRNGQTRDQVGA